MMTSPTVAIVTKARGTFFKPLYEAFAQAQPDGWRTALLWPAEHSSEHPEELFTPRASNLDIVPLSSAGKSMKASDATLEGRPGPYQTSLPSRQMWRELAARNVKAVLIHEFSSFTLQALLYARWKRLPVMVSTEVGKANGHFFGPRTRWWHAFWGQFVSGVVACCPAAHQPLSGRKIPSVATYHAVDSRLYLPAGRTKTGEPVTFVYLGQMIRRKGLDLLLQAAVKLKAQGGCPFSLLLVGGGDLDWVRQMVQALSLSEQVVLPGFLSGAAIRDALNSADAFVLPTRQDTYAAVVHEAACLGLPLLVSKHAGAAEALVQSGKNGFVIDPEDAAEFANRMADLMQDSLREPMRAVSRDIGVAHSAHLRGGALWQWMRDQSFATA